MNEETEEETSCVLEMNHSMFVFSSTAIRLSEMPGYTFDSGPIADANLPAGSVVWESKGANACIVSSGRGYVCLETSSEEFSRYAFHSVGRLLKSCFGATYKLDRTGREWCIGNSKWQSLCGEPLMRRSFHQLSLITDTAAQMARLKWRGKFTKTKEAKTKF